MSETQATGKASWFFASFFSEVHSKAISDKERRDWMVIPDAMAAYIHEAVNKVFPRLAQFLVDVAQTQPVVVTRYGKIFCTSAAIAIGGKGKGGVGEGTE